MSNSCIARASAAFMFFVAAVGAGETKAQNYDGDGVLKFGVFLQGASSPFEATERLAAAPNTISTGSDRIRGFGAGFSFGYDWSPRRTWLVGIEADAAFDGASGQVGTNDFSTQYLATFRGRLGAYVRPDLLLYATGGYALLGAKYEGDNGGLSTRAKEFATLDGLAVGGGFEVDWHHVMVYGEYLFADFNKWEFTGAANNTLSADADTHVFRLGVKFKYGHDHHDYRR